MISRLYKKILKPLLFLFPPEWMHHAFGWIGNQLGKFPLTRGVTRRMFAYNNDILAQTLHGHHFPNPVGLAAGFDKDVQLCHIASDVGFGFTEIGSLTYQAYDGNPKPRLIRLKKSEGLIVYYGLKNKGIHRAMEKFSRYKHISIPVIVSVAKTNCAKTADMDQGLQDYLASLRHIKSTGLGDIIDLNVSCPNAFGGENFASKERLEKLLTAVNQLQLPQPIFVKLPVDYTREQLQPLLQCCVDHRIAGVIIANLTKTRIGIQEASAVEQYPGGISGKPVSQKSNVLISQTYKQYGKDLTIIGVGGIFSAKDAYDKIKAGASLVQLITGMIFQGPQLIGDINRGLVNLLHQDGYTHISQAIGADHR